MLVRVATMLVCTGPWWSVLVRVYAVLSPCWSVLAPCWSVMIRAGPYLHRVGPCCNRVSTLLVRVHTVLVCVSRHGPWWSVSAQCWVRDSSVAAPGWSGTIRGHKTSPGPPRFNTDSPGPPRSHYECLRSQHGGDTDHHGPDDLPGPSRTTPAVFDLPKNFFSTAWPTRKLPDHPGPSRTNTDHHGANRDHPQDHTGWGPGGPGCTGTAMG